MSYDLKKINFNSLKLIENDIAQFKNVELMIVTKNRDIDIIKSLIKNNYRIFGENKVQEAKEKYESLEQINDLKLHLIGPLQTNKVKVAVNLFDNIQSIDRPKLIHEICKYDRNQIKTKNFYIQINIGREKQKSGVLPEQLNDLYDLAIIKKLNVIGLMCIPPNNDQPEIYFEKMLELKNKLNKSLLLSMGMSDDYRKALSYSTNMLRIGSKIFN